MDFYIEYAPTFDNEGVALCVAFFFVRDRANCQFLPVRFGRLFAAHVFGSEFGQGTIFERHQFHDTRECVLVSALLSVGISPLTLA